MGDFNNNRPSSNRGGGSSRFGGGSRGRDGGNRFGGGSRDGGSRFGGGRFGGGRDGGSRFGGGSRGRDGGFRERPSMHPAVCDNCGNNCEVPFKPTGDKPIYCSDCFQKMNDDGGSYSDRPERKKPSYSNDSVYHKSHKSFDGAGQGDSDKQSAGNRALAKGISDLNEKMDKLIALLSGDGQPKTQATPKASAMTVAAIDTAAKKGRGAKKSVPAVKAKVEKKPAKKKAATKKAAPKKASTKKAS